eukprot:TRINITY_DN2140_c1_g1_i5.p2 TRINITY_DN2140_c1_g1~~TRINITY_DN2140_c1_g1_i5.p2  ORF type:complete len:223 (-),score=-2.87 TRINITY_DN2140_c1_g1_i5:553-1221(-)
MQTSIWLLKDLQIFGFFKFQGEEPFSGRKLRTHFCSDIFNTFQSKQKVQIFVSENLLFPLTIVNYSYLEVLAMNLQLPIFAQNWGPNLPQRKQSQIEGFDIIKNPTTFMIQLFFYKCFCLYIYIQVLTITPFPRLMAHRASKNFVSIQGPEGRWYNMDICILKNLCNNTSKKTKTQYNKWVQYILQVFKLESICFLCNVGLVVIILKDNMKNIKQSSFHIIF